MRGSGSGLGRSSFPRLKHPGGFLESPRGYVVHRGGPGCVWEGTTLSHRQRNQGRSFLPEAVLGSLGSSSSSITYLRQNCDAINSNMLPQAHPLLGLQGWRDVAAFLFKSPPIHCTQLLPDFKHTQKPGRQLHTISWRALLRSIVPDYNKKVFTQRSFIFTAVACSHLASEEPL